MIQAVKRCPGRPMAWVLGGRDAATGPRLYDKRTQFTAGLCDTANWDAWLRSYPTSGISWGKAHTHAMARDHSPTKHHLARMTRRTKVVSKSTDMLQAS